MEHIQIIILLLKIGLVIYMNDKYNRLLNPTEAILQSIPAFVEAFVTYYGEEERDRITKTFNDMLVIGYTDPSNIKYTIRESNEEKSTEIINEFLNKMTSNKEEQDKLKKALFDNHELEYDSLHPINNYMQYLDNDDVSTYQKEKAVSFLKQFYPETTIDNLDEMIKSGKFKNIDTIIPLYKEMLKEYKEYQKETKPYLDYASECSNINRKLEKEYQIKYIEQIKSLFTDLEYQEIKNKIDSGNINMINAKTKNFVPSSLNGETLIDSFSKINEERLQDDSDWRRKSIQNDRISYFKNFGIDLGIGAKYEDYLNNPKVKELFPKVELVEKLKDIRTKLYTEMMNKYYQSISEYKRNTERIEKAGLLAKDNGYDANAYSNNVTAICTNVRMENNQYVKNPIFLFNTGGLPEYRDHTIIHELNHVFELTLQNVDGNNITMTCGWDIMQDKLDSQAPEKASLEKKTDKRNYELFNEIINELIAQEISQILTDNNFYLFNTKDDKKITGGTSYEGTKFLVKDFFEIYKKEIIESRKNGDITILYNYLGKENIEALNELFHEFNDSFGNLNERYQMYMDLKAKKETKATKKFQSIIKKREQILLSMEEYYQSKNKTL